MLYPWQESLWQAWAQAVSVQLGHAYLLLGPRGWGKRQFAESMVQTLLGKSTQDKIWLEAQIHPDYRFLAEDSGIDDVRIIVDFVHQTAAARKVILVESVEAIGMNAQNALLKGLEEPPGETVWILLAHTRTGVLPTIISRCQIFMAHAVNKLEIENFLSTKYPKISNETLAMVSALGCGGPLQAEYWLERETLCHQWVLRLCGRTSEWVSVDKKDVWDVLHVWQYVIMQGIYCHFTVETQPIFKDLLTISIERLFQFLDRIQECQKKRRETAINGQWLIQSLYQEWV